VTFARIEKCAPAAFRGELDDAAGRPFVIGEVSELSELCLVGRRGVGEALALPVLEEVCPVLRIDIGGTRKRSGLTRGRVTHTYTRGGINFWGLGAFIKGGFVRDVCDIT
jgi:hypothetical protein